MSAKLDANQSDGLWSCLHASAWRSYLREGVVGVIPDRRQDGVEEQRELGGVGGDIGLEALYARPPEIIVNKRIRLF